MKCGCYIGTGVGKNKNGEPARVIIIEHNIGFPVGVVAITQDFKTWFSTADKNKHIKISREGFKIDDHKSINEQGKIYYWMGCRNVGSV